MWTNFLEKPEDSLYVYLHNYGDLNLNGLWMDRYDVAVWIFASSALLELLSEPLWVLAQTHLYIQVVY